MIRTLLSLLVAICATGAMAPGADNLGLGPTPVPAALPPSGSAGGDLGGTFPNPTVAKINGVALGTTTATAGAFLLANGTTWVGQPLTGDVVVTGNGTATVGAINGTTLGTTTATAGNLLVGSGTAWATQAVSGAATIGSTGVVTLGGADTTRHQIGLGSADSPTWIAASLSPGTVTSSTPAITATQTWNAVGTTFDVFVATITDTASAAATRFISCTRGGANMFKVDKVGNVTANGSIVSGTVTAFGALVSDTVGSGLQIKTGSNAKMGTGTLSSGTVIISTTAVKSTSMVFLTDTSSGIVNLGALTVSSISDSTSFTVKSSNVADTSTFNWIIVDPAP